MEFDTDECDLKWWRGEEGELGKKGEWRGLGAVEIWREMVAVAED
jgi:hypothetical protein